MFGALLTDLSKAFDCLLHDIIIAKLNAYGFDMKALNFIYDYLSNPKQRTKLANAYSSWQNILFIYLFIYLFNTLLIVNVYNS